MATAPRQHCGEVGALGGEIFQPTMPVAEMAPKNTCAQQRDDVADEQGAGDASETAAAKEQGHGKTHENKLGADRQYVLPSLVPRDVETDAVDRQLPTGDEI